MNKVILVGTLSRDPELRQLSDGRPCATFVVATLDPDIQAEYHSIVAWDDLGESVGRWLGKDNRVMVEGRVSTRAWDDEAGRRWKTEIVATGIELLVGPEWLKGSSRS